MSDGPRQCEHCTALSRRVEELEYRLAELTSLVNQGATTILTLERKPDDERVSRPQ